MINSGQQSRLLKHAFLLVAMCICFEAFAARPPGVPKKRDCKKSLTAVKVTDLDFGLLDGTTAGTVTVATTGARSSSGPTLVSGGSVNAAAFDVSNSLAGCDFYAVKIRVRRTPNLTGPGSAIGSDIYITDPPGNFNLSPVAGVPTRVYVGATITTGGSQTQGTYTTARPFRFQYKH